MNLILIRMVIWASLVFMTQLGLAASKAMVVPVGIQSLTLAEALAAYHEAGEIEAFQCIHIPVGANNLASNSAKPIAIEFDEKIYLRVDGKLLGVSRVVSGDKHSRFLSDGTKVDVFIKKTTNPSEYRESADRLMQLTVVHEGRKFSFKTFGAACGI